MPYTRKPAKESKIITFVVEDVKSGATSTGKPKLNITATATVPSIQSKYFNTTVQEFFGAFDLGSKMKVVVEKFEPKNGGKPSWWIVDIVDEVAQDPEIVKFKDPAEVRQEKMSSGLAKGSAFNKAVDAAIAVYNKGYMSSEDGDQIKGLTEFVKFFFEEFKKINTDDR